MSATPRESFILRFVNSHFGIYFPRRMDAYAHLMLDQNDLDYIICALRELPEFAKVFIDECVKRLTIAELHAIAKAYPDYEWDTIFHTL